MREGGLSVKKKVRGGLIRHTECEGGVASGASEKITPVNMLLCQFLVRGGFSRQNKIVRGGGLFYLAKK